MFIMPLLLLVAADPPSPPVEQLGPVKVAVARASVGRVRIIKFDGERTQSANPQLMLVVTISNLSDSAKINYRTWQAEGLSLRRDYGTLRDEFGNLYRRVEFGVLNKVAGQIKSESIYPRKALADLLIFEPPIERATRLRLELPGENVGQDGEFRLDVDLKAMLQEAKEQEKSAAVPAKATRKAARPTDPAPSQSAAEKAKRDSARKLDSLMRTAKALEKSNIKGAIENYREVVKDFPDTPEAKAAAERIKALTK